MGKGKKEKLGNYICKIGKYDIRQVVIFPSKRKGYQGQVMTTIGSTEGRIYHGKKLVLGKLSGASEAIKKAYDLVYKNGDADTISKKALNKYHLQS